MKTEKQHEEREQDNQNQGSSLAGETPEPVTQESVPEPVEELLTPLEQPVITPTDGTPVILTWTTQGRGSVGKNFARTLVVKEADRVINVNKMMSAVNNIPEGCYMFVEESNIGVRIYRRDQAVEIRVR